MLLGVFVFVSAVENLVLVALPHGGQRQARRNAWLATIEGSAPRGHLAWSSRPPVKRPHSAAE